MAEGEDLLVDDSSAPNVSEQNSTSETELSPSVSVFDQPLSLTYCDDDDELLNHDFLNSLHDEKTESIPSAGNEVLPSVSANNNQLKNCVTEAALKNNDLVQYQPFPPILESDLKDITLPDNDLLELERVFKDYGYEQQVEVANLKERIATLEEEVAKYEKKFSKPNLKRYSAAGVKYLEKQAAAHEKCEKIQTQLEKSLKELQKKFEDVSTELTNLKLGKDTSDKALFHVKTRLEDLVKISDAKTRKIQAIRKFVKNLDIISADDSVVPAIRKGSKMKVDLKVMDCEELEKCDEECAAIRRMLNGIIDIKDGLTTKSAQLKKELKQKKKNSGETTEPEDTDLRYKFRVFMQLVNSLLISKRRLVGELDRMKEKVGTNELKNRIEVLSEENEKQNEEIRILKAENSRLLSLRTLSSDKMNSNKIEILEGEKRRLEDKIIALQTEILALEKKLSEKKLVENSESKDAWTETNLSLYNIAQDDTEAMVSTSNMVYSPLSDESLDNGFDLSPVADSISFPNNENVIMPPGNNLSTATEVLILDDIDENVPHSSTMISNEQLSKVKPVSSSVSTSSYIEKENVQSTSIETSRNRACDENSPHSSTSTFDEGYFSCQSFGNIDSPACQVSPSLTKLENNSPPVIGSICEENLDEIIIPQCSTFLSKDETCIFESYHQRDQVHLFPYLAADCSSSLLRSSDTYTAQNFECDKTCIPTPVQDGDNNKAHDIPYIESAESLSRMCRNMYKETQNYSLQAQGEEILDRSSTSDVPVQQTVEGTSKKCAFFSEVKKTNDSITPLLAKKTFFGDGKKASDSVAPLFAKTSFFGEGKKASDSIAPLLAETSGTTASISHTAQLKFSKMHASASDLQTSNSFPNPVLTQGNNEVNSTTSPDDKVTGSTATYLKSHPSQLLQSSSLTQPQKPSVSVSVNHTVDVPSLLKCNKVRITWPVACSQELKNLCVFNQPTSVQASDMEVNSKNAVASKTSRKCQAPKSKSVDDPQNCETCSCGPCHDLCTHKMLSKHNQVTSIQASAKKVKLKNAMAAKTSQKCRMLKSKNIDNPQACQESFFGPYHNLRKRLSSLPIQTYEELPKKNIISSNKHSALLITKDLSVSRLRTKSELINISSKSANYSTFPLDKLIPVIRKSKRINDSQNSKELSHELPHHLLKGISLLDSQTDKNSKSVNDPQNCKDSSYSPCRNLRKRLPSGPVETDKQVTKKNRFSSPDEHSAVPMTNGYSVSEPQTGPKLVGAVSELKNDSNFLRDKLVPSIKDASDLKPKRKKKASKKQHNKLNPGKKIKEEESKPKCYSEIEFSLREALEKLEELKYFPEQCLRYRQTLVNVMINPVAVHSVEDIISEITTFLASSNRIPLLSLSHYNSTEQSLPVEERTLIEAFSVIKKKNKMLLHGLSEKFLQHIHQKILYDKTIVLPGLLAFCRVYTVISKDLGCSVIKYWNFCIDFLEHCSDVFIYGMATFVSVWPELWQFKQVPEFVCLGKVISRIVTEKPKLIFTQIKWDEYLKACKYLFGRLSAETGNWEALLEEVCSKMNDTILSGQEADEYDKLALKAISLYCGWSGTTLYEKIFAVCPDIPASSLNTEIHQKCESHLGTETAQES